MDNIVSNYVPSKIENFKNYPFTLVCILKCLMVMMIMKLLLMMIIIIILMLVLLSGTRSQDLKIDLDLLDLVLSKSQQKPLV